MEKVRGKKGKILIADDSEINRMILSEILKDDFEIIEVKNGAEAVSVLQEKAQELSLVLLDIMMPEMDGFEVLAYMNRYHWIENVPVIMVSAESASSYIQRAYEFGVTDYISRPFDRAVVYRRVSNTIMLYAKQRRLAGMVVDQIYEKERSNNMMVTILSHIVEFRNGESGLHVLHISKMTEMLLRRLVQKENNRYPLTQEEITSISTASALHDIGKISIPTEVLNKPGRFTAEEFELMKQHSAIGASMLSGLEFYNNEPLVKVAYEICRWHHERFDGKGYPDGLKGDEIPISAQVVSLADVYDALTSERCYKKAFSHEKAMEMIFNGECGAFNPVLLECLQDISGEIQDELMVNSPGGYSAEQMRNITTELLRHEELTETERIMQMLEFERGKFQFLAYSSKDIVCSYLANPPMLSFTREGAKRLGVNETIVEPFRDEQFLGKMGSQAVKQLTEAAGRMSVENPCTETLCELNVDGETRKCRFVSRCIWTQTEPVRLMGGIARIEILQEADTAER